MSATTTLTHSTAEEMFLGPTHTYTVETVDDETDAATSVEYTRTVEGWFRTVERTAPGDVIWRREVWNARSRIGAVVDAVAGDPDMLGRVVSTELHYLPAHPDKARRRKALDAALAKHGLAIA